MSKRALIAALCLSSSGCVTWTSVSTRSDAIDLPADTDCDALRDGAKQRGFEIHVQSDADAFAAEVIAVDETWLRHTVTQQIVLGHWWSVGRERPRASTARLWCPELGERELEVRTCSASARRFTVVDPRPLADWVGAGTPSRPCSLTIVHQLRREEAFEHQSVILRRSIRPYLESSS